MNEQIPPKLYWACRRGMLELDVLLGNFLKEAYLKLSANHQETFIRLLSENDQDLFTWLTGHSSSNDANLQEMVEKIREHAKNRH